VRNLLPAHFQPSKQGVTGRDSETVSLMTLSRKQTGHAINPIAESDAAKLKLTGNDGWHSSCAREGFCGEPKGDDPRWNRQSARFALRAAKFSIQSSEVAAARTESASAGATCIPQTGRVGSLVDRVALSRVTNAVGGIADGHRCNSRPAISGVSSFTELRGEA
jgi:hypothetical protein